VHAPYVSEIERACLFAIHSWYDTQSDDLAPGANARNVRPTKIKRGQSLAGEAFSFWEGA